MAKPGRKLIELDSAKVRKYASRGLSQEQIALCLGLSEGVIYSNKKRYEQFKKDYEEGKAVGIATVTNALFDKCEEGNVQAQKFYLATRDRDRWQEQPDEAATKQKVVVDISMVGVPTKDGD